MRVIAGQWKSLTLAAPDGTATRPTTDRVKESIFNFLPHQLSGVAVDLFAGSGGLGIEAMSRGAHRAVFVDRDAQAIRVVRRNLDRLQGTLDYDIWRMDWKQALLKLAQTDAILDWLFIDPPYAQNLWEPVLTTLSSMLIDVRGGVVCEMPKSHVASEIVGRFRRDKYRVYGDIAICIYTMEV